MHVHVTLTISERIPNCVDRLQLRTNDRDNKRYWAIPFLHLHWDSDDCPCHLSCAALASANTHTRQARHAGLGACRLCVSPTTVRYGFTYSPYRLVLFMLQCLPSLEANLKRCSDPKEAAPSQ
jgi:hypothetical protein